MTLGRDNIKTKHTALYFPNGIHHLRYIREMKPSIMKLRKSKINKMSDKFFHEMRGPSPLDIEKNRKMEKKCDVFASNHASACFNHRERFSVEGGMFPSPP